MTLSSLAAATPQSSLEWIFFLAQKYGSLFLEGTFITLYVAGVGTLAGFLLGYLVGVIQDFAISAGDPLPKRILSRTLKVLSWLYVELFRGTPMIVQGMIIYYGLLQANIKISPIAAGILVTLLNTGSYMAETVRGGIKSIDPGQREGALALGMSPVAAMLSIVLPQAFRNILPEMANTFLTNIKMTSVLNVIGVSELFMTAKTAGSTYYKYFEAYLVIALIYLVLCFAFNQAILLLERKISSPKEYALATEYMDNE